VQGPRGSPLCKVIFLNRDGVVEPVKEGDDTKCLHDLSDHAVRTVADALNRDLRLREADEKSTPLHN